MFLVECTTFTENYYNEFLLHKDYCEKRKYNSDKLISRKLFLKEYKSYQDKKNSRGTVKDGKKNNSGNHGHRIRINALKNAEEKSCSCRRKSCPLFSRIALACFNFHKKINNKGNNSGGDIRYSNE